MTAVRCVETLQTCVLWKKEKNRANSLNSASNQVDLSLLHERKQRRKHFLVISKSILLYSCCQTGIELGTEIAVTTDSFAKFTSQPFPNLFLFSSSILRSIQEWQPHNKIKTYPPMIPIFRIRKCSFAMRLTERVRLSLCCCDCCVGCVGLGEMCDQIRSVMMLRR